MKKNQKVVVVSGLIFLCVLGVVAFLILHKSKVTDNGISAIVTKVVDKPNQAEDGYYGITAKDNEGRQYSINATGYLNTPLLPESNGERCIDVPKVKIGDKISFNLPKAEGQNDIFDICYKKDLTGYYFSVK